MYVRAYVNRDSPQPRREGERPTILQQYDDFVLPLISYPYLHTHTPSKTVLSNDQLRAAYDRDGEEAAAVADQSFIDPSLFFNVLFGSERVSNCLVVLVAGWIELVGPCDQMQTAVVSGTEGEDQWCIFPLAPESCRPIALSVYIACGNTDASIPLQFEPYVGRLKLSQVATAMGDVLKTTPSDGGEGEGGGEGKVAR